MRSPRRAPIRVSWTSGVDAFVLVSSYTVLTRTTYRSHLRYAGELLGNVLLAEITRKRLTTLRAAVLGGQRGAKHQALTAARVFLRWAADHGLHQLAPEIIAEALRNPGVAAGGASRRARRRQSALERLPTVQPPTLGAYGYPPGVAGLAQVAEEIDAIREALQNADPVRSARVLRSTEHPIHRQSGQGSERAALAILREAASGKRGGADAFSPAWGIRRGRPARLACSHRCDACGRPWLSSRPALSAGPFGVCTGAR